LPQLDPYAELGIAPGADTAAVRRAYRARAKATHPDHGGDPVAFQRTKRASMVLLDPARRARFDRDGVIDDEAPDNALADALVAISQLLDAAMVQCAQSGRDPTSMDLLGMMTRTAVEAKSGMSQRKHEVAGHLAQSEKLRGRFKVKKGKTGGNRIAALLDQRIAAQQANIALMEREIAKLDRAVAMLADYSFDRDQPHPAQGAFGMVNIFAVS